MTSFEAEKFLKLEANWNEEDLESSIDDLLFELKNFFLKNVPIQKLFHNRLEKILGLNRALNTLKIQQNSSFEKFQFNENFTESIFDSFQTYHQERNKIKAKIIHSNNILEIHYLVIQMIKLEKKYAFNWFKDNSWDESTIVSKEPDPMEILNVIKEYNSNGVKSFQDLKNNQYHPPEKLLNEMKRLSLLFKKY